MVTIECSANQCRFKNNAGYYGICTNPKAMRDYRAFDGARVKVAGCSCASCNNDCGIIPFVNDEKEVQP